MINMTQYFTNKIFYTFFGRTYELIAVKVSLTKGNYKGFKSLT